MADTQQLNFTVVYKGQPHTVASPPQATLSWLHTHIDTELQVAPQNQSLLLKGTNIANKDAATPLSELGIRNGTKLMLVGATREQIESFKETEREAAREEEKRARARLHAAKPQDRPGLATVPDHGFDAIEAIPNFTHEKCTTADATRLLRQLSQDKAILAIMKKRQWRVQLLKEFPPSLETGIVGVTDSCLLGFNQNKGQVIGLRLRTDNMLGFRHYHIIIDTLLHELVHMELSEHDHAFFAMHRVLTQEYQALKSLNAFQPEDDGHELLQSVVAPVGGTTPTAPARDMAARAALARLAQKAQMDEDDGPNPYVYRPRRSLRVGAEYQVAVPDYEGPPGPTAVAREVPVEKIETIPADESVQRAVEALEQGSQPVEARLADLRLLQHVLLNILDNPGVDQYRAVRLKASPQEGRAAAIAVLEAAGFSRRPVDGDEALCLAHVDERRLLATSDCVAAAVARLMAQIAS